MSLKLCGTYYSRVDMAVSEFERKWIEKIMGVYLEKTRPPVHIRNELGIAYRIGISGFLGALLNYTMIVR